MGIRDRLQSILRAKTTDVEFGVFDDYRVAVEPNTPRSGDSIHVGYQGLLKNDGADVVYLHYAFDGWSSPIQTVKMHRHSSGDFGIYLSAEGRQEMNFCFKDSADHWDNNNGSDWALHLY